MVRLAAPVCMQDRFIAHCRESDQKTQSVWTHLEAVSSHCQCFSEKISCGEAGRLLGLLHDLGKYSKAFQQYIRSSTGMLDPDRDDAWVDAAGMKGKIDHSTAGAQWVWQHIGRYGGPGRLMAHVLAVCLASHHGGLLDCLDPVGKNIFLKRMGKENSATHLTECLSGCDEKIKTKLDQLISKKTLQTCWLKILSIIAPQQQEPDRLKHFRLGFLCRFLFSCLLDADRIDSADFEHPENRKYRRTGPVDWQAAITKFEQHIAGFEARNEVDTIRSRISRQCLTRSDAPQGIYTLSVPTGGGKTLSSMRFALHHAKKHQLDHIFYIIPYTSIIDQNAKVIREILDRENDGLPWVLEHHSNLDPEKQTWHTKLTAENWDTPVIFTTMVQFLEAMFGGGTRGPRRLHNLARSVLIFDEIQCLPVNCVHLFCNGLNFLVNHTGSTAVLCTATQPLLGRVNREYGALELSTENELVHDVEQLFKDLKRVRIVHQIRNSGWSREDISDLAISRVQSSGNCLVVVNTKKWARQLYKQCFQNLAAAGQQDAVKIFHLSTSLCPAHRRLILDQVIECLYREEPVLCISTQLIEAGVDIDFNTVIRFLAGLDSIAQAAGRCNRNGRLEQGEVVVLNPAEEQISMLEDIRVGKDKARRVMAESEHDDLLAPMAINRYFQYYFYERADLMRYPLSGDLANTTLLDLLADNPCNVGREQDREKAMFMLQQSFKTAGREFAAIDAPTKPVIVQYGKGKEIIAELATRYEPWQAKELLRKAQKFSVNLFPHDWKKIEQEKAIFPLWEGEDVYYLDAQYYSDEFGVTTEPVSPMDFLSV